MLSPAHQRWHDEYVELVKLVCDCALELEAAGRHGLRRGFGHRGALERIDAGAWFWNQTGRLADLDAELFA